MSANSAIEWTDHTFNSWTGCTKVSPGCDGCYAEAWSKRAGPKVGKWGPGMPRVRTTPANWRTPLRWNATPFWQCSCCGWRGVEVDMPIRDDGFGAWAACPACHAGAFQAARARVFCASLADVFDNAVDPSWRSDLFDLIRSTPNLDWLLLTKRIGNAFGMLPMDFNAERYPNVWLGATVVNQAEADRDIPKLLAVNARVRFLSMEPLLGPVDLVKARAIWSDMNGHIEPGFQQPGRHVSWVIVGGESGPGARPMHPDSARDLRDQCQAAGVPFFFKQWGEWVEPDIDGMPVRLTAREGDPEFYDAASKVDGFLSADGHFVSEVDDIEPDVRYLGMKRVGKKAAGRLLDGRTWEEFPR